MTGYESKRAMARDKLIELAKDGMGMHSPDAPEYIVCEALIEALAQPSDSVEKPIDFELAYGEIYKDQRAALAKSLAQPAQEPVAWMYDWFFNGKLITGWIAHSESEIIMPRSMALNLRPLYTAPPQPAQEPVGEVTEVSERGFKCEFSQRLAAGTKLYAAAPKENK